MKEKKGKTRQPNINVIVHLPNDEEKLKKVCENFVYNILKISK